MTTVTVHTTLTPIFCVIDDVHDDLSIADLAVTGRFVHAGVELDLGHDFDWATCGLHDDEEWRIEFVKMYEGLALAHAFARTGCEDYLDTWVRLVRSYARTMRVGHESSDVSGRRIQNWVYAAQRFAESPMFATFPAGFIDEFMTRLQRDLHHLRANLTKERNHRTLEIYALLVADLALGDIDAATADLELLADNAATDIWADGVQRECSSDYHLIVLRSLAGALRNAEIAGIPAPTELVAATHRAADFALWLHRPDGSTPALSDGDQGDFRNLLGLAAQVLGREDLAWVASDGQRGTPPAAQGAVFPNGGYVFWRTDWTPAAAWGVFDCGPLGDGGHGHYDQLSVELVDGTNKLVVDPGRYTYADNDWRHWFKGTAAHNTVTVDGRDQIPYRRGRPKADQPNAELLARRRGGQLDVAIGKAVNPHYDAVHTRTVALVEQRYWVIRDQLEAPSRHVYQARWHLDPTTTVDEMKVTDHGTYTLVQGNTVRLLVWCSGAVVGVGVGIEDGWVSPSYGVKLPAPVVTATIEGADAELFTVISGAVGPEQLMGSVSTADGCRLRLGFSDHDEFVGWDDNLHVLHHRRS